MLYIYIYMLHGFWGQLALGVLYVSFLKRSVWTPSTSVHARLHPCQEDNSTDEFSSTTASRHHVWNSSTKQHLRKEEATQTTRITKHEPQHQVVTRRRCCKHLDVLQPQLVIEHLNSRVISANSLNLGFSQLDHDAV